MKRKILFALPRQEGRPLHLLQPLEKAGFVVEQNPEPRRFAEEELIARLAGVWATIAASEPYTSRVFSAASDLRMVARHGVGYDHVDVMAATRHGVAVAMSFGTNADAVADYALVLMGAVRRRLLQADWEVRRGGWRARSVPALSRATVGIVGLGRIGQGVARRCRGFDMRILAVEPSPDPAVVRACGVELVELDDLFRRADIITLHAPAVPETRNLVDRNRLALMKPTAILVNTARGDLVDEEALYEALASGRIAGAGLDVFRAEPPRGSPLLALDNVVLSPHCASRDDTAAAATLSRCVDNILRYFRGEPLAHPGDLLNPEAATQ